MSTPIIYTIGHSNHSLDYFTELLKKFSISCVIDVRSIPASSYNPQFNKDSLSNFLEKNGISYLHFSKEFGARHTTLDLLDEDGKVDFEKVRKSLHFLNGIERLKNGVKKGYVIALMCAEAEPLNCHRFSMISVSLKNEGFQVMHILKDKTLKSNDLLELELMRQYERKKEFPQPSLFEPNVSIASELSFSYGLKNKEIAYTRK